MSSVRSFGRLGKQFHRLPNIGINVITDVGLDETSPPVPSLWLA
jgi:hypothetical protein